MTYGVAFYVIKDWIEPIVTLDTVFIELIIEHA